MSIESTYVFQWNIAKSSITLLSEVITLGAMLVRFFLIQRLTTAARTKAPLRTDFMSGRLRTMSTTDFSRSFELVITRY
jgi:hypothetical protein